jgi:mannose-6-phosphate isomerase-like protein (cupin superfamily)
MNRRILMSVIAMTALAGVASAEEPLAFTDLDTLLKQKPLSPGTDADIIDSQHIQAGELQIVVARKIDLHTHEDSVHRIYVARGSGVFRFAGQSRTVKAGDIFTVPKHLVHGFEASPGSEPLVLLVIETPD